MAQAKRIKPKPKSRAKKPRKQWDLPWGLMLVILACGVVIGMLLKGAQTDGDSFGSGLKTLLQTSQDTSEADQSIAELIEEKSSEKEFDFYTLLPDIEKVMPDDLPDSEPSREHINFDYYLQAASFKEASDAEKLRARLGLQGYKSVSQAREVKDKGTYYRVRLGPYPDKRKAKTVKNKLQKLGVKPFIYSVKK